MHCPLSPNRQAASNITTCLPPSWLFQMLFDEKHGSQIILEICPRSLNLRGISAMEPRPDTAFQPSSCSSPPSLPPFTPELPIISPSLPFISLSPKLPTWLSPSHGTQVAFPCQYAKILEFSTRPQLVMRVPRPAHKFSSEYSS